MHPSNRTLTFRYDRQGRIDRVELPLEEMVDDIVFRRVAAGDVLTVRFDFCASLGEGSYSVAIAAHDSETHMTKNYEWRDVALVFKVMNLSVPRFVGTVYLPTQAQVSTSESEREVQAAR